MELTLGGIKLKRNMDKEFVPYEEALALKELNFDEDCIGTYSTDIYHDLLSDTTNHMEGNFTIDQCVSGIKTPLYQQAFRWFRENKGLYTTGADSIYDEGARSYLYHQIYDEKDNVVFNCDDEFSSHEEAELACLKKLIELCQNH